MMCYPKIVMKFAFVLVLLPIFIFSASSFEQLIPHLLIPRQCTINLMYSNTTQLENLTALEDFLFSYALKTHKWIIYSIGQPVLSVGHERSFYWKENCNVTIFLTLTNQFPGFPSWKEPMPTETFILTKICAATNPIGANWTEGVARVQKPFNPPLYLICLNSADNYPRDYKTATGNPDQGAGEIYKLQIQERHYTKLLTHEISFSRNSKSEELLQLNREELRVMAYIDSVKNPGQEIIAGNVTCMDRNRFDQKYICRAQHYVVQELAHALNSSGVLYPDPRKTVLFRPGGRHDVGIFGTAAFKDEKRAMNNYSAVVYLGIHGVYDYIMEGGNTLSRKDCFVNLIYCMSKFERAKFDFFFWLKAIDIPTLLTTIFFRGLLGIYFEYMRSDYYLQTSGAQFIGNSRKPSKVKFWRAILMFIICMEYKSALKSHITAPPPPIIIQTPGELINTTKYSIIIPKYNNTRTVMYEVFKLEGISEITVHKRGIGMERNTNFTFDKRVQLLANGTGALVTEDTAQKKFFELKVKNFTITNCSIIKNNRKGMHESFVFQGRAKYFLFSVGRKLTEAGFINEWYANDYALVDPGNKNFVDVRIVRAFRVTDWRIAPIFLIWCICVIGIGGTAFLVEKIKNQIFHC